MKIFIVTFQCNVGNAKPSVELKNLIPNIATLYHRIARGAEGGHEFARFLKLLLTADYGGKGQNFISESDASGDYRKVDGYILDPKYSELLAFGFHFKFYPSKLSKFQKKQVVDSIEAAIAGNRFIRNLVIITPEDFIKEEQKWFDNLRKKYERKTFWNDSDNNAIFHLFHWGHTKIIELCLKHDHIGSQYFPELYPVGIGKFKLVYAAIDCTNSNWCPFENEKYSFYQMFDEEKRQLTTDPLFDFHFANNSPDIVFLNKIEIHIEKTFTLIKGIPVNYFLRSIGTMSFLVDFKKPVNVILLDNPMIFPADSPMRFKLQLTRFTKRCPGNCAYLKFWFRFSNFSVPTESFYLSF